MNCASRRAGMESLEQRQLLAIDLVAQFIDAPLNIRAGDSTEFRLRVTNIGDETAYDVLVETDLEASLVDMVWQGPLRSDPVTEDGMAKTEGTGNVELLLDLQAEEFADFLIHATPKLDTSGPLELSASASACFAKTPCPSPTIGTSVTRLPDEGFVVTVSNDHTNPIAVDVTANLDSIPNAIWSRQDAFQTVDVRQLDEQHGFVISQRGYRFGWAIPMNYLSSAGDLTGDGIDDFVYGGGDDNDAHIYLENGAPNQDNLDAFDSEIRLTLRTNIVDASNNAIGDFNGDGIGDVIATTVKTPTIYSGGIDIETQRGTPLVFEDSSTPMLRRTAGGGDLNGDGFDELLLSDANRTIVFFGHELEDTLDLDTLDQNLFLEIDAPQVSTASLSGDVNGDGFDDLLFQIEGESSYHIIFGDADLHRIKLIELQELRPETGLQVATNYVTPAESRGEIYENKTAAIVGDINADGCDDVVHTTITGANLLFGHANVGADGFLPSVKLTAEMALSVDKLGDFNGDGVDDVLLASLEGEPGVYVVFGSSLIDRQDEIDVRELTGLDGVQVSGNSLVEGRTIEQQVFSNVGDINSDGVQDLALGGAIQDPLAITGDLDSTFLYIVYGRDLFQSGEGDLVDRQVRLEPNSEAQYIVQSQNGIGTDVIELPFEVVATPLGVDANDANNVATVALNIVSQSDLNADHETSILDFDILRANFGQQNVEPSEGDLNNDGVVDFTDFLLFRDQFARTQ